MSDSSIGIAVIVLVDQDQHVRIVVLQRDNRVNDPGKAPTVYHLYVRRHVHACVDGRGIRLSASREAEVLGQSIFY